MSGPVRNLNLSNAVSIVLYEAIRQVRGSRQSSAASRQGGAEPPMAHSDLEASRHESGG
jgi:tRNA C32,U32 (ribose-2'-O)-methylase TrmJ